MVTLDLKKLAVKSGKVKGVPYYCLIHIRYPQLVTSCAYPRFSVLFPNEYRHTHSLNSAAKLQILLSSSYTDRIPCSARDQSITHTAKN